MRCSARPAGRFIAARLVVTSLRHNGLVLIARGHAGRHGAAVCRSFPKGFLPQQDTGAIVVTTEAAQNISIPAMSALQAQAAAIVQQDPAVAGVASLVGAGTVNATPNVRALSITLKPRRQRTAAPVVIARLQAKLAGIPGAVPMQPVQDIQIGARVSRTQFNTR
jgi:multidrug efflux pump